MEATPDISIVVCSAGRRASLAALFSSFGELKLPEAAAAEVILVDNSPKGTLQPVFEALSAKLALPANYIHEPRPGLAMAQNRGLKAARGDVVAFTDDDCLVAEDWLLSLAAHFARDPALQGLGGRIELYDPADSPVTIKSALERERLAAPEQLFGFLHGCNMAFRRAFLMQLGGFDTDFGAGSGIGAGNDTELLFRAFQAGSRVAYEPDVLVFHDHGRRGWRQVRGLVNTYQMANGALLMKHAAAGDRQAKRLLRKAFAQPVTCLVRRPLAPLESVRALHRLALISLGALRYRRLSARQA